MKKSLIFLDVNNHKNSIDLLEVIRLMYGEDGCESYVISVNNPCEDVVGAFDKMIQVTNKQIFQEDPMIITDIIEELHKKYQFDCILISASHFGRMLAPRIAMRLHVGLTADVTEINVQDGVLEMIRPAFSGKIMAGIVQQGEGPTMMSVRQNVFSYENKRVKKTQMIPFEPRTINKSKIKRLEIQEKPQSYDIQDSEVLISGGGGTIKNFHLLEQLAKELHGEVSASRMIIDKGIAPRNIQVGQSGKTVHPKLYIALGISGAIQHVEGLKNVDNIISVNTNSNAPICWISDLVVEGDAATFIEKLVKRIEVGKRTKK